MNFLARLRSPRARLRIHINPTIDFDLSKIIPIREASKIVAVFYVPLSPVRPHMSLPEDKGFFWKRTNKGNERMTYEEVKMQFLNYEERIEKLKLLYIELLSNLEQLNNLKVEEEFGSVYSLVTLDSTVINSLLVDTFTIIGRNKKLVRILFSIRERIKILNNKVQLFFATVALPLIGKSRNC